jgi:hypothetical protein
MLVSDDEGDGPTEGRAAKRARSPWNRRLS